MVTFFSANYPNPWDTLLWSVIHLDAAIFIYAVVFLWGSQRQTHFGSLVLDQANHLSSYFCTWPLLSNTPSHSCRRPTQHLRLARLLPSQLSGSPSVLIKVIDLPKSCLFRQLGVYQQNGKNVRIKEDTTHWGISSDVLGGIWNNLNEDLSELSKIIRWGPSKIPNVCCFGDWEG